MNIPKYSLDNPKVIYFFLAILMIGGILAFESLGKKEDSPFVIKSAVLITRYPGATPQEVRATDYRAYRAGDTVDAAGI